jgi:hypothetical protein
VHRIPLFSTLLAIAVLALGCSGDESMGQKTPEQIAELEADCIKNTPVGETEGLEAIAECLKRARE